MGIDEGLAPLRHGSTWSRSEVRESMKSNRFYISKKTIERVTLWILALGLLIAVTLSVAKSAVQGYQELQDQIHRPTAAQAKNSGATH